MTITMSRNPACGAFRATRSALISQSGEEPVVIEYLAAQQ